MGGRSLDWVRFAKKTIGTMILPSHAFGSPGKENTGNFWKKARRLRKRLRFLNAGSIGCRQFPCRRRKSYLVVWGGGAQSKPSVPGKPKPNHLSMELCQTITRARNVRDSAAGQPTAFSILVFAVTPSIESENVRAYACRQERFNGRSRCYPTR